MKKLLFYLLIVLLILSVWKHEPWITVLNWINDSAIHIPDRLSLLLTAIIAFLLVLLVEWIRGSSIEFYNPDPVSSPLRDGRDRKLLKIGVKAKSRPLINFLNLSKLLASHVHAFASLEINITHAPKPSYRAKWDIAPEPIEYPRKSQEEISLHGNYQEAKKQPKGFELKGRLERENEGFPRLEMLPLAMQPENLLPGDRAAASIVTKHQGERHFWIYDPEYYFGKSENQCSLSKAYLKVVFKSSLGKWEDYFCISNPDSDLKDFNIERISKDTYGSKGREN